jgi:hypothetical protein
MPPNKAARVVTADPVDLAVWKYLANDPRVTDQKKRDYAQGRIDALRDSGQRIDSPALEVRLDHRKNPNMPDTTNGPAQAHIAHLRRLELAHLPESERETTAKRLDSDATLDPAQAAIKAFERLEQASRG